MRHEEIDLLFTDPSQMERRKALLADPAVSYECHLVAAREGRAAAAAAPLSAEDVALLNERLASFGFACGAADPTHSFDAQESSPARQTAPKVS